MSAGSRSPVGQPGQARKMFGPLSLERAFVTAEGIRFEVHGGNCRLIVAFKFEAAIAFIKFIGAQAEYDRIDAATVEFSNR